MAATFCLLVKGVEPRSWRNIRFFQLSVNIVVIKTMVKISYREQYGQKTMRYVERVIKGWYLCYILYLRAIVFNYVAIKYNDIPRLIKNFYILHTWARTSKFTENLWFMLGWFDWKVEKTVENKLNYHPGSITSQLPGAQRTKERKVVMFTPLTPSYQAMICVPFNCAWWALGVIPVSLCC